MGMFPSDFARIPSITIYFHQRCIFINPSANRRYRCRAHSHQFIRRRRRRSEILETIPPAQGGVAINPFQMYGVALHSASSDYLNRKRWVFYNWYFPYIIGRTQSARKCSKCSKSERKSGPISAQGRLTYCPLHNTI